MEFLIKNIIYSIVLIALCMILYFAITYLIEYPGRGEIERYCETEKEKKDRQKKKKTIAKKFLLVLILIFLVINTVQYISMIR